MIERFLIFLSGGCAALAVIHGWWGWWAGSIALLAAAKLARTWS
jgi:hypothetical protein